MRKTRIKSYPAKTQKDVAEFFGRSLSAVQHWAKCGMPGQAGQYDLRDISQWLLTTGPLRSKGAEPQDDPLLDGADSPGLERYRQAKASITELDLEAKRGTLIELAKARTVLTRWSSILRRLGEKLAKRFGNEATLALNDALNECHRVIGREFCTEPAGPTPDLNSGVVSASGAGSADEDD